MIHNDSDESFQVICTIPGLAAEDYTELTPTFLKRIGKLLRRQLRHERAAGCVPTPPPDATIIHEATVDAGLWRRAFCQEPPTRFGFGSSQEH